MKITRSILLLSLGFFFLATVQSCSDKTPEKNQPKVAPQVYDDLIFSKTKAYFATNGKTSVPVDAAEAQTMVADIDLTYIFNSDYTEPGFFEPVSRSDTFYWDEYIEPWLSEAIQTKIYYGDLSVDDYNAAKSDQSLIGKYFDNKGLILTPHPIFPEGSCIGGRQSSPSVGIGKGTIFGFINTKTQKRGLVYVDIYQHQAWPYWNSETKVDIIVEK